VIAIIHDQLLRSHSLAFSLAIPGLASPVIFMVGSWMYGVVGVQGIDEEIMVQKAVISEAGLGNVS